MKKALFVGVQKYQDEAIQNLRYAIDDAYALQAVFRKLGFETNCLQNPSQSDVLNEISRLTKGLGRNDTFLFFFSGHGFSVGGEDLMFCPEDWKQDLTSGTNAGLGYTKLKARTTVRQDKPQFDRIFLFDTCRSYLAGGKGADGGVVTLSGGEQVSTKNLRPMNSLTAGMGGSVFVLRSCSSGEESLEMPKSQDDSSNGNGLFTLSVERALESCLASGSRIALDDSFYQLVLTNMGAIKKEKGHDGWKQTPEYSRIGGVPLVLAEERIVVMPPPVVASAPSQKVDADFYLVEAEAKDIFERKIAKAVEPSDASLKDAFEKLRILYSAALDARQCGDSAAARKLFADFTQSVATYETDVAEAARQAERARQTEEKHRAEAARQAEVARAREAEAKLLRGVGVKAGDVKEMTLPGGAKMKFVWCPPGTFTMGSPAGFFGGERGRFDDETLHRVTLTKGFWLGQFEVTQAQWRAVMGNNPSGLKGDNRPVETVSWEDCRKFVKKCNAAAKGVRFALPTEAQWEYACRAGTTGPYAGTGNLYEMGWYNGSSGNGTHPVGRKRPNAWNLYDMHGNVWEWCADRYEAYEGDCTDPTGPASGEYRVLRGGGWGSLARYCRSAVRDRDGPGNRSHSFGFRLLCSAGPHAE